MFQILMLPVNCPEHGLIFACTLISITWAAAKKKKKKSQCPGYIVKITLEWSLDISI